MEHKGAWDSGVFETGQSKTRAPTAHGRAGAMEAGTTPDLYNPSPTELGKASRTIGIVIVVLRSVLVVFTLIAVGLMAASKQDITETDFSSVGTTVFWFTSSIEVKFTDIHAFVGLFSVGIVVLLYSIVQVVLCVVQVLSSGTLISSVTNGGSLISFIIDSVLAYALIGAAAAAADFQSVLKQEGSCTALSTFCGTTSASVAIAFIAFIILATCAALYPFRLYRTILSLR